MPMRLTHDRVDREATYVWIHIGLVLTGLSMALRPQLVSQIYAVPVSTSRMLAVCMLTGSTLALAGAALGSRWFFLSHRIQDVRVPYAVGGFGQLSVVTSLFGYVWLLVGHSDLIGTLAGGLSIAISAACIQTTHRIIRDIHKRTKLLAKLSDAS